MEITQTFNVIVIGGGPGGYHLANILAKNGKTVALFEEKSLGGTCLNEGCIPSKAFLKSAKIASGVNHSDEYGVLAQINEINQIAVVERKNLVVSKLVMGVRGGLRKNKVKLFFTHANVLKCENDLRIVESDGKIYGCEKLVIATGSEVFVPPIKGVELGLQNQFVLTSSEIFDVKLIPSHLVVIGGGIIGVEMASYFSAMGSKVTILEGKERICSTFDAECCEILTKNLKNKGIEIITSAMVNEITENGVIYKTQEQTFELCCDKILLSVGRVARTDGFGIENLGIEYSAKGILVNESMQTTNESVYAVGDVNGKVMLAHTAYKEAEVCAEHILGRKCEIDYNNIPSVLYSSPECAWVGKLPTEDDGEHVVIKKLPMIYSGRFVAENICTDGICKLVIDKNENVLLGAFLIGDGVSELIFMLSTFIQLKTPIDIIKTLIFPHPTLGEIIKETLES